MMAFAALVILDQKVTDGSNNNLPATEANAMLHAKQNQLQLVTRVSDGQRSPHRLCFTVFYTSVNGKSSTSVLQQS